MRGAEAHAFLPPAEFVRSPEQLRKVWAPDEALEYTRWLATHHYENFHVVSFLLPKRLHQDFYNVYSYCRWADDLADEIGQMRVDDVEQQRGQGEPDDKTVQFRRRCGAQQAALAAHEPCENQAKYGKQDLKGR